MVFERIHDTVEVGQFIQFSDVVPAGVCQPVVAGVVHLLLFVQHLKMLFMEVLFYRNTREWTTIAIKHQT